MKDFEERLLKLGIVWDSKNREWQRKHEIESEIDALSNKLGHFEISEMSRLGNQLIETADHLKEIREKNEQKIKLANEK